ncbi:hypothetical protein FG386_000397 [Cryptosporidium ryanae]|uniref:uncharacterized protein n=1 Tax=Cryptosporidium ryanae TaxID=515981 RepID=UPI003519F864|nr:hypothetical protein FG386_000397 [Cryptosporidium ryanae]
MNHRLDLYSKKIESKIRILKAKLDSYSLKLAPVPLINCINTKDNGKVAEYSKGFKKKCEICKSLTKVLYFWNNYNLNVKSREIIVLEPQKVCSKCINILDINCLISKIAIRDEDVSELFLHFLRVNKLSQFNVIYLQHCISISFAIGSLSK